MYFNLCLALVFVTLASQILSEVCDEPIFKCFPTKLDVIQINGLNFSCADDKVCNLYNIFPCALCVDRKVLCQERYTCTDILNVTLTKLGYEYQCEHNFMCNKNYTDACEECISTGCPPSAYKCDPNNPEKIDVEGAAKITCPANTVCNKYNIGKSGNCSSCIDPKELQMF